MEIEVQETDNQMELNEVAIIDETPNKAPMVQTEAASLLQIALEKDVDIDKLEKLIELKNKEEERICKKEFDFHFSEMQREFEPIDRSKAGYSSKYAPLDLMVAKYNPIIAKHGFSFRWKETALEGGGKKVTFILSGWGYTNDTTSFDVPLVEGTKQMNAIQVQGALSTYGQRYTFKAGLGITETDEDVDGNLNYEDGIQYADKINMIRICTDLDQLSNTFTALWNELKTDKIGREVIGREKDIKKKELSK